MTTGERLKRLRKEQGLSADELGAMIGKDRSTIYRYERGDIEHATVDVIPRLAKALQTTPQYLLGWETESAFSWMPPSHLTRISKLAEQSMSWTLGYSWTDKEFELLSAQAKYIQRIKNADEYESMMQFLVTFYKQLNK